MIKRTIILAILAMLPSWLKIPLYRILFGWSIGRNVYIGLSYIDARKVVIYDGVRIGHFNRFCRIPLLEICEGAQIHNGNTFLSDPDVKEIRRQNGAWMLHIGRHTHIIGPHFFDVQDTLWIGENVAFTGRGTIVYTHKVDASDDCLRADYVMVGDSCLIGAGGLFSPGTVIGSQTIVAMGAAVSGPIGGNALIGGVPAKVIRQIDPDMKYFKRKR